MVRLPEERQPGCVWMDKASAYQLRELMMAVCSASPIAAHFAFILYEALLKMTLAETDAINVPLGNPEILLINGLVKNKHWATADAMLLQTWQVAYELKNGRAFHGARGMRGIEEAMNAVHPDQGEAEGEGASRWRG